MTEFGTDYASLYDVLYQDKDYDGETAYVLSLLQANGFSTGRILDMGCGTGIHARKLGEAGNEVVGIDRSEPMLKLAKERSADAGNVSFTTGDMTSWTDGSPFDAVLCLFHALGYQTTNANLLKTLQSVAANLTPGGLFVFDFWHGPAVLLERPESRMKQVENDTLAITRFTDPTPDYVNNCVDVRFHTMIRNKADGRSEENSEVHRMRYFFLQELIMLLQQCGFEFLASHAWMTTDSLTPSDWSGVIVARLQG